MDYLLNELKATHLKADLIYYYNGYNIGGSLIYNPWSVGNCLKAFN